MIHHPTDPVCSGCEDKLKLADPYLINWFRIVKEVHPSVHICWSWRGEADQNADYESGRSEKRWPNSAHNFMINGRPNSLALDLFEIMETGAARFRPEFYVDLYAWSLDQGFKVRWGGNYKFLKDQDHFYIDSPTQEIDVPIVSEKQS